MSDLVEIFCVLTQVVPREQKTDTTTPLGRLLARRKDGLVDSAICKQEKIQFSPQICGCIRQTLH